MKLYVAKFNLIRLHAYLNIFDVSQQKGGSILLNYLSVSEVCRCVVSRYSDVPVFTCVVFGIGIYSCTKNIHPTPKSRVIGRLIKQGVQPL